MTTSHASRIFASGDATTLYVPIPAGLVTDSQFPFEADEDVTGRIDEDRLVVRADVEEDEV